MKQKDLGAEIVATRLTILLSSAFGEPLMLSMLNQCIRLQVPFQQSPHLITCLLLIWYIRLAVGAYRATPSRIGASSAHHPLFTPCLLDSVLDGASAEVTR